MDEKTLEIDRVRIFLLSESQQTDKAESFSESSDYFENHSETWELPAKTVLKALNL